MKKIIFFLLLCSFLIINNFILGKELEYTRIKKPQTKLLPTSVTTTPQGEIFAVDGFTGSIIKYSSKWRYQYTLKLDGIGSIVDLFYYNGHIYALSGDGKLFRFNSEGKVDFYKEYERGDLLGQLINPRSFYIDNEGIYISDSGNSRIQIFNLDGTLRSSFGYKTFSISGFLFNTGISKLGNNLVIADNGSKEVKIYDENGFYVNNLRNENGGEFIFLSPEAVFVDRDGYIYIVDSGSNQISIYSPKGTLVRLGKQGSKSTEFYSIKDIWVDEKYIYIADTLNGKIKILNKNTYEFVKAVGASKFMKISSFAIIILILMGMMFIFKKIARKKGQKNE
jgi:DNA-binding beta-propeller fold protein YncE